MNDGYRNALADVAVKRAADTLSDYFAAASEDADAFKCLPGWTKRLVRHASADEMSRMIRRGPSNSSAKPYAKRLRTGFQHAWF